jgi:3-oxoacyl-(acyl-carrier-protein) synthase
VKIGGDLSSYDIKAKAASLATRLPEAESRRLRKLVARGPWSARLSLLLAADAWLDAQMDAEVPHLERAATIVAGTNVNSLWDHATRSAYHESPNRIDPLAALHTLDTNHAACVSEFLGLLGPIYTTGGACASGNVALRAAMDEIRYHGASAAMVVGAVLDLSPVELHSMALMGAVSTENFNNEPERASRPFDARREGFVAAHGGGALFVESLAAARARGARIHAEVLGVVSGSDGNHFTNPSEEKQATLTRRLLQDCGIAPEQVDYVNAHATSTPLGDLNEIRVLRRVFGAHASRLRINATKSMLGHTCWASAIVETVAVALQMQAGRLHPTINFETPDPEIDLDVCANEAVAHEPRVVLKNAFGFGGINCISLLQAPPDSDRRKA